MKQPIGVCLSADTEESAICSASPVRVLFGFQFNFLCRSTLIRSVQNILCSFLNVSGSEFVLLCGTILVPPVQNILCGVLFVTSFQFVSLRCTIHVPAVQGAFTAVFALSPAFNMFVRRFSSDQSNASCAAFCRAVGTCCCTPEVHRRSAPQLEVREHPTAPPSSKKNTFRIYHLHDFDDFLDDLSKKHVNTLFKSALLHSFWKNELHHSDDRLHNLRHWHMNSLLIDPLGNKHSCGMTFETSSPSSPFRGVEMSTICLLMHFSSTVTFSSLLTVGDTRSRNYCTFPSNRRSTISFS